MYIKTNQSQLEELEIELSEHQEWKSQILIDLKIKTLTDIPEEVYDTLMRIIRQKKYNERYEDEIEHYYASRYEDHKYECLEPEELE